MVIPAIRVAGAGNRGIVATILRTLRQFRAQIRNLSDASREGRGLVCKAAVAGLHDKRSDRIKDAMGELGSALVASEHRARIARSLPSLTEPDRVALTAAGRNARA